MKYGLFFISSLLSTVIMQAQTKNSSAVGEYYLQGVMETASGFKLNADHTFEFFFSYGALDRSAQGSWKQEGSSIIFNSTKKHAVDYTLVQSKKQPGTGITINITGSSEHIKKLVHAIVKHGDATEQCSLNEQAVIQTTMAVADSIILLFEWCPDKRFAFAVKDTTHNYFEFRFEPSIMDVVFDNFPLQLNQEGLNGPHPLMETKTFLFKKAQANN